MDDGELLRRIAAEDLGAFKTLVDRYQNKVVGFCSRLLSHPQNAEDVAPDGDDPASAWTVNETREIIRKAVASLPEKQKAMLILSKFEGHSYQEIAEIMYVSVASVESCLHRAKLNLQKELAPLFPDVCRGRKF